MSQEHTQTPPVAPVCLKALDCFTKDTVSQ